MHVVKGVMRPQYLIAIIGVALAFVLAVDVRGASVAQHSADEILNNSTRSIELVEDVRWQVHRLGHINHDDVEAILATLERDIREYTPLLTAPDESETWAKVHDALTLATEAVAAGDFDRVRYVTRSVGTDVDRLVEINHQEAAGYLDKMSSDRTYEMLGDIVAVLVAAVVIALLARALFKSQARERTLAGENLGRAEERNRELDAFAGRAAHDLRSPLNPIRGYAEMISIDATVPPETRRQASLITKGVLRMVKVIDEMLALSRAGYVEDGEASFTQTLDHVREELDAELRDAAVTVAVDGELAVACSENSLEQILRNLLGNASKYRSPERQLAIDISARIAGDRALIVVADNGTGMDSDSLNHAFDPFFRGRRDIAGTGLGLSIVERIVRTSGGTCSLEPNAPSGTRVVVKLPLARAST
jgi:signal transduction histidine kinase